ncbi:MAG: NUDIX hydrolase [Planctomycetia bacterium]|nr:NUDIX hydrolase [Planctomycetia bacterium]
MPDAPEELLTTRRFRVVRQTEPDRDGQPHAREYLVHPGAATILPIFSDGRVLMIRNRRIAVGGTLLELPAGTLDPGEPPATTAHRELIEETGYRAEELKLLCEFHTSPGILSERMYLYLATGLTAGAAALEPGEQIETVIYSWDEALAMVDRGEVHDGKSLVGLMFYDRILRKLNDQ